MKKLKTTIPDGGAPLGQFPVLRDILDIETKDAIEALLDSVIDGETEGVILSGCEVSGSSGNFAISAGYIFVDNKVLRYPGTSGHSATQYLKIAAATEESGVFADGNTKAYIDVETAINFSTSGGGTGTQYITYSFAANKTTKTLLYRLGGFINDDAVTTAKILDANVTTAKIANSNVTVAKMAANSVDSNQYVDGSIDRVHLAADIIDGTKIEDEAVDSEHYADGSIDDIHLATARVKSTGVQLLMKKIDIGDWNMDTDVSKSVAHGLTFSKINSVSVTIINDASTFRYQLNNFGTAIDGNWTTDGTNVIMTRVGSGLFDSTSFDSTSFNRGHITIVYEA